MNETKKRLHKLIKDRQRFRASITESCLGAKGNSTGVKIAPQGQVVLPVNLLSGEPQVKPMVPEVARATVSLLLIQNKSPPGKPPAYSIIRGQTDQPMLSSANDQPAQPQGCSYNNQPAQPQMSAADNNKPLMYLVVNNQPDQVKAQSVVNNQTGQAQVCSVVSNQTDQVQVCSIVNNQTDQAQMCSIVNNQTDQAQMCSIVNNQTGQAQMCSIVNNQTGQAQVCSIVNNQTDQAQSWSIIDHQCPENMMKSVINVQTLDQLQVYPTVNETKMVKYLSEAPRQACQDTSRIHVCSTVVNTEFADNEDSTGVVPMKAERETLGTSGTTIVIKTEGADTQGCTGVAPMQADRETLGTTCTTIVIKTEGAVHMQADRETLGTTAVIKTEGADSLASNQVFTHVKMEPVDEDFPGDMHCSRWAKDYVDPCVTGQSQECCDDPLRQTSLHSAAQEERVPFIVMRVSPQGSASEVGFAESTLRAPTGTEAHPRGEQEGSVSELLTVHSRGGGPVKIPFDQVYQSAKYQPVVRLERLPLSASDIVRLGQYPEEHVTWSCWPSQSFGATNRSRRARQTSKACKSSPQRVSQRDTSTPQRKPGPVLSLDKVMLNKQAACKLVTGNSALRGALCGTKPSNGKPVSIPSTQLFVANPSCPINGRPKPFIVVLGQTLADTSCQVNSTFDSTKFPFVPRSCDGMPIKKPVPASSTTGSNKPAWQSKRTPESQATLPVGSGRNRPLRKIQPKPVFRFVLVESPNENRSVFSDLGDQSGDTGNMQKRPRRRRGNRVKYTCELCLKKFPTKSALKVHIGCHRGDKETCEVCQKVVSSAYLERHRKLHTDPYLYKRYLCPVCGLRSSSRAAHTQHMFKHTGERELCPVCHKSIATGYIKAHMKMHTNPVKRRYQCTLCEKAFTLIGKLNRHMLCHKGVRETCPICRKSFSADYLKRHMGRHGSVAREMPYGCSECGQQFRAEAPFRRHLVKKHGGCGQHRVIINRQGVSKTQLPQPSDQHSSVAK